MSTTKHTDYTVGWICALPSEQAAALLDETHDKLPLGRHDTTYLLGRIDVHNVVVACLPEVGNNAAARCLVRLQASFASLRFVLLVGVGGGVPTRHDIRLGDVVVNMPTKRYRGVVQYDFGTRIQDDHLEIRDTQLARPPEVLITAVTTLQTQSLHGSRLGEKLSEYANSLTDKYPQMQGSRRPELDQLFNSEYVHRDRSLTCEQARCDVTLLEPQQSRGGDPHPHVHQGLIASGNEVMRDAQERDRLAKEIDVLCFEMEAAGLMTEAGCLVIRGICDYCDSHKNKVWQGYAAAVAAAYARELLKVVPGLRGQAGEKDTQAAPGSVRQGSNNFGSTFAMGSELRQGNFAGNIFGGVNQKR